MLPLVDVGSRQFDEICRDLMRQSYPDLRPVKKRRSGLPQFGVDVEGFNDLQEPEVVVSAKMLQGGSALGVPSLDRGLHQAA